MATASPFISTGAPLLLPGSSGPFFDFCPPSAAPTFTTVSAAGPSHFVNGFTGFQQHTPLATASTAAAIAGGPANGPPFTPNTFIPVEGRMQ